MEEPLHTHDLTRLYRDESSGPVDASPAATWRAVESMGGELGWYAWGLAWGVRGLADAAIGGPGVRLTRPDRPHLEPGDVVDWWRVETVEQGSLLRLRAETKLPGTAWLDLSVVPDDPTYLTVTTWFDPAGLAGRLYWLSITPAHGLVFGGLRRQLARRAAGL